MNSNYSPISDRDYCVNSICEHAGEILRSGDSVNLGRLIIQLQTASFAPEGYKLPFPVTREEALSVVDEYPFEIYEESLYRLNRELGPLECVADAYICQNAELCWGYAGLFDERQNGDWVNRALALAGGHPDYDWYAGSEVPNNLWRMRSVAHNA